MNPMSKFLVLIPAGVAVERFYLTSPIHELGHGLMGALLGTSTTMHLTHTTFSSFGLSSNDLVSMMYAGVVFEIAFFLLISWIFAVRKPWVAGIAMGVTLAAYVTHIASTDVAAINYAGIEAFYILAGITVISLFLGVIKRIYRSGLSDPVV